MVEDLLAEWLKARVCEHAGKRKKDDPPRGFAPLRKSAIPDHGILNRVIKTFGDGETELLYLTGKSRLFQTCEKVAWRKLRMLDAADTLKDLSALPGNRLEPLKGTLMGQYSIRVNDQYRICFEWTEGEAHNARITDYH